MIWFRGKDHSESIESRERFMIECFRLRKGPYVYLQTCNRVELYGGDGFCPQETAEHLFRVTSGLESVMIGEKHIQGQVKRAYRNAINAGTISSGLHRLFQAALHSGKRVRAETALSTGAVTHSQAVLKLLKQEFISLADFSVLLIGVHRTNETIGKLLRAAGCESITVINRTPENARTLAETLRCRTALFADLTEQVTAADIIISATSAEDVIIPLDMIASGSHKLFIDLAVPRDIDPRISAISGCKVFNVADIESGIDRNLLYRRQEISAAEEIIREEISTFSLMGCRETMAC